MSEDETTDIIALLDGAQECLEKAKRIAPGVRETQLTHDSIRGLIEAARQLCAKVSAPPDPSGGYQPYDPAKHQ